MTGRLVERHRDGEHRAEARTRRGGARATRDHPGHPRRGSLRSHARCGETCGAREVGAREVRRGGPRPRGAARNFSIVQCASAVQNDSAIHKKGPVLSVRSRSIYIRSLLAVLHPTRVRGARVLREKIPGALSRHRLAARSRSLSRESKGPVESALSAAADD